MHFEKKISINKLRKTRMLSRVHKTFLTWLRSNLSHISIPLAILEYNGFFHRKQLILGNL